ncbi:TPA: DNA cytosine methyltransferase, partial [Listeria innocua]|nr:DNA cytosine methyltransferase [Listeria innocua]
MYKVIDLFSGAGGLSYGFSINNSFKIIAAVENNKFA